MTSNKKPEEGLDSRDKEIVRQREILTHVLQELDSLDEKLAAAYVSQAIDALM